MTESYHPSRVHMVATLKKVAVFVDVFASAFALGIIWYHARMINHGQLQMANQADALGHAAIDLVLLWVAFRLMYFGLRRLTWRRDE